MSRMQASSLLAIVLLVILLAHRTDAQVLYGSVVGTVVDETGRSVAGAQVRITSTGTQQVRETETTIRHVFISFTHRRYLRHCHRANRLSKVQRPRHHCFG